MNARERLLALLKRRPNLTTAEALKALGVSRQRLHAILKTEGVSLRPSAVLREPVDRMHPLPPATVEGLPPYVVNGIKEMIVAVDLLKKGFDVYRSLTAGGLCDLVAVSRQDGASTRIEVKSASLWRTGRVTHSPTHRNSYDVLALVFKDGAVEYRPPLPF